MVLAALLPLGGGGSGGVVLYRAVSYVHTLLLGATCKGEHSGIPRHSPVGDCEYSLAAVNRDREREQDRCQASAEQHLPRERE